MRFTRWTSLVVITMLAWSGLTEPARSQQTSAPREVGAQDLFTEGMLVVKGEGLAPSDRPLSKGQRRLMAQEAAKVIAQRNLIEVLRGVRVTADSLVKDMEFSSNSVRSSVEGMVRGATVVHEEYDAAEGSARVYLRLDLNGPNGVTANLLPIIQKPAAVPQAVSFQPHALAPAAGNDAVDSLIIDATGKNLRPALINRILAGNGEVIFEPSKVAPEILAKRGCGDYTSDVGKARAILASHGATNPIVITASAVQRSTDVQVSESDATAIFSANQKGNFLEGARVVFVL